ncbi:MAG: CDP-alcohol phosphatidyltransferase family protein [Candidatus Helarchaeota archaeon]
MVFDTIPALKIAFEVIFPLILVVLLIILFVTSLRHRRKDIKFMTFDEFLKEWCIDHGQGHRLEYVLEDMKKNPVGALYQPLTYKGGKLFARWGFTANKISFLNLILSLFIFYLTIMAGDGHSLDLYSQQPFYGALLMPTGFLVLFTGVIDGVDGSIARLLNRQTKSGAWLDGIIDRLSDILTLVCLIPGGFLSMTFFGLDFTWLIWTNVLIIFLYEYMRAKHHELGLHMNQPFIGERPTRIIIQTTFYLIYGISSFSVMITYLITPTGTIETSLWNASHPGIVLWTMVIFQCILLIIMLISILKSAFWIWKHLKEMDIKDGVIKKEN